MRICQLIKRLLGLTLKWERLFSKKLQGYKLNNNQLDNLYIEEDSQNIDNLLREMELLIEDGYFCFCIDSKMKLNGGKERPSKIWQLFLQVKLSLHR